MIALAGRVMAADVGQIPPNTSSAVREWFQSVKDPRTGIKCCDVSDGHLTDYVVKEDGTYWVEIDGENVKVPPEAVISDSKNPFILGIVWYRRDNLYNRDYTVQTTQIYIRCFVPGGGA